MSGKAVAKSFNKTSSFEKGWDVEKTLDNDPRFGQSFLLQHVEGNKVVEEKRLLMKEYLTSSESDAKNMCKTLEERTQLSHPHLQRLHDWTSSKQSDFCSTYFKFKSYYTWPVRSLAETYKSLAVGEGADHETLTHVMYQMLQALDFLHGHGKAFNDVRPEYIGQLENKNSFILCDRLNYPGDAPEVQRQVALNATRRIFMSPQLWMLVNADKKAADKVEFNRTKADTWALGMTLLMGGLNKTVKEQNSLYLRRSKTAPASVNCDLLQQWLNEFCHRHDSCDNYILGEIVRLCLEIDECARPNAHDLLSGHLPDYAKVCDHFHEQGTFVVTHHEPVVIRHEPVVVEQERPHVIRHEPVVRRSHVEHKPVESRVVRHEPVVSVRRSHVEHKPVHTERVVEHKPAHQESRVIRHEPVVSVRRSHVEHKPVHTERVVEHKPAPVVHRVEHKPVHTEKVVEHKPVEHRPVEHRVVRREPVVEHKPVEHKPVEHRVVRREPVVEHKPVVQRTSHVEHKPVVHRTSHVEHKPVVHRTSHVEHKPVVHRTSHVEHTPVVHHGHSNVVRTSGHAVRRVEPTTTHQTSHTGNVRRVEGTTSHHAQPTSVRRVEGTTSHHAQPTSVRRSVVEPKPVAHHASNVRRVTDPEEIRRLKEQHSKVSQRNDTATVRHSDAVVRHSDVARPKQPRNDTAVVRYGSDAHHEVKRVVEHEQNEVRDVDHHFDQAPVVVED